MTDGEFLKQTEDILSEQDIFLLRQPVFLPQDHLNIFSERRKTETAATS